MTLRLVIGIDPGLSGAIALLADGVPAGFIDMPTKPRAIGDGNEVDGAKLGAALRGVFQAHTGAHVTAVVEYVNAMPSFGKGQERRTMGAKSIMNFGESNGKVKCALEMLAIPFDLVKPDVWKRRVGLLGEPKDASRTAAIERFPSTAPDLARKKDGGRADALWIAQYGELQAAA